jgi:hypothetical protein
MRNLLAFLAAALLTFAALGWYLDWYNVTSTPLSGGHREVKINLNTPKIGEDFEKGGQKVRQMLEKTEKKDKKDDKPAATAIDPKLPVAVPPKAPK